MLTCARACFYEDNRTELDRVALHLSVCTAVMTDVDTWDGEHAHATVQLLIIFEQGQLITFIQLSAIYMNSIKLIEIKQRCYVDSDDEFKIENQYVYKHIRCLSVFVMIFLRLCLALYNMYCKHYSCRL